MQEQDTPPTTPSHPDAFSLPRPPQQQPGSPGTIPDALREWRIGDCILNLYDVISILGEGGMGKVHKVYHREWSVDLAVKSPRMVVFSKAGGKADFIREAETWINLGLYPHIVSCYYVRIIEDIPRIFVEYVEGGNLAAWIRSRKLYMGGHKQALQRMLDIAIQFAWGLEYAHERGVIHQDVKPSNVMVAPDGIVKVTDFGLAKAQAASGGQSSDEQSSQHSMLVSWHGMTMVYCSPEQAARQMLSRKTDIWSWGVSILEMFVGNVTWLIGSIAREALANHKPQDIAIPPMPVGLVKLLASCFAQQPEQRPATMLDVATTLQEIYQSEIGQPYPRKMPRPVELLADSLNNQALSLYDLGKSEEAQQVWEQALQVDPYHREAFFNYGVVQWREGRWSDLKLVQRLEEWQTTLGKEHTTELLARVHLERGDMETALPLLEEAAQQAQSGETIQTLLTQARAGTGRCISTFEDPTRQAIVASYLYPNGQHLLFANRYGQIFLCDVITGENVSLMGIDLYEPIKGEKAQNKRKSRDFVYVARRVYLRGKRAISCDPHGKICLWDTDTGRCLQIFETHVQDLDCDKDGKMAVFLYPSGDFQLREIETGICIHSFQDRTFKKDSICLSSDGRLAFSGSPFIKFDGDDLSGCALQLWEMSTGRCLASVPEIADEALCFSQDGRLALSATGSGPLHLWEIPTLRCLSTWRGHTFHVTTASFNADGRFVLSGSGDGTICLWETHTGRCWRTFLGHRGAITSIQWSFDETTAVSCGVDGFVRRWKLPELQNFCYLLLSRQQPLIEMAATESQATAFLDSAEQALARESIAEAMAYTRQARALPGWERAPRSLSVWNSLAARTRRAKLRDAWLSRELEGEIKGGMEALIMSSDGSMAIAMDESRHIYVWDIATGRCVQTLQMVQERLLGASPQLSLSTDGRYLLSGCLERDIQVWDLATGQCHRTLQGHPSPERGYYSLLALWVSPDGKFAISTASDTRLWEVRTGRSMRIQHEDLRVPFSPSPDWRFMLAGSHQVSRCEIATGQPLLSFPEWSQRVPARLSSDGSLALSIEHDGNLRLRDTMTGHQRQIFKGHTGAVTNRGRTTNVLAASLSADGCVALSSGLDKTLRLWDTTTGQCLRVFQSLTQYPLKHICLSPDGQFALTRGKSSVAVWQFDWEREPCVPADWDDGAFPFLETFLTLHTPYAGELPQDSAPTVQEIRQALTRHGTPSWTEQDFQKLLLHLQHVGYGWLHPEGIRKQLEQMVKKWQGAPPLG